MATYRHWSVSLWRDPDDVSHCRILSPDKTEWRLISDTLCGWRHCFVADQLWLMSRIGEEEDCALMLLCTDVAVHWCCCALMLLCTDVTVHWCSCMSTGSVVGHVLDDVVPILRANLQPNKDAEVRSKFLTLLSRLIVNADTTLNSDERFVYCRLQHVACMTCAVWSVCLTRLQRLVRDTDAEQ